MPSFRFSRWPLWLMAFLTAVALVFYTVHLATGRAPSATLFSGGWPIYTSAALMVLGIVAATAVTYQQLAARQWHAFCHTIPAELADQPLPAHIRILLPRVDYPTVGDVLWAWGNDPHQWRLSATQGEQLGQALSQLPGMEPTWVRQPPWRPWNPLLLMEALAGVLFWGLIGARLYHVLAPAPSAPLTTADYWANGWLVLNVRQGGLGFYGALAGGLWGLALFGWRRRVPVWGWADAAVVGVALGQAIGRWGHFFNQELYGRPSTLPWAVIISPSHRLPHWADVATYQPLFLYESLTCLAIAALLAWVQGQNWPRWRMGDTFALYGVAYALGRVVWEAMRVDGATLLLFGRTLPTATWVSLTLLILLPLWRLLTPRT